MAKGDACSSSPCRTARRTDGQARACDPPGLCRCAGDQLRTAESTARSISEDLAGCPNRCLCRNYFAHGCQTRMVGVDQCRGNLRVPWAPVGASHLASQWVVVRPWRGSGGQTHDVISLTVTIPSTRLSSGAYIPAWLGLACPLPTVLAARGGTVGVVILLSNIADCRAHPRDEPIAVGKQTF